MEVVTIHCRLEFIGRRFLEHFETELNMLDVYEAVLLYHQPRKKKKEAKIEPREK